MGRPSKLSDRQWAEIGRRLANGETTRALAKEFGVGAATVSGRFSERVPKLKSLANSLASVEREVECLPVSEQATVRSLADQLKAIGSNLARAARAGSDTAAQLAEMANGKVKGLLQEDGKVDQVALLNISDLTMVANRAATPALRLVAASQGKDVPEDLPQDQPNMSNLSDEELDQFIALQEKAGGL